MSCLLFVSYVRSPTSPRSFNYFVLGITRDLCFSVHNLIQPTGSMIKIRCKLYGSYAESYVCFVRNDTK
jgi:hypothetical protein